MPLLTVESRTVSRQINKTTVNVDVAVEHGRGILLLPLFDEFVENPKGNLILGRNPKAMLSPLHFFFQKKNLTNFIFLNFPINLTDIMLRIFREP